MATKCDEDKREKSKLTAANRSKDEDGLIEDEEKEEESLSLSDLPINNKNQSHEKGHHKLEAQEDFNFNSFLADTQMCAADEVFSKGKILPFRHSISSETGLTMFRHDIRPFISRSQSMDHRYMTSASGSTTRSSSIRSSLSSGSTSSTNNTTPLLHRKPPRARIRNQFHSHPSPTPQIKISSTKRCNTNPGSQKWRFFHIGSVQTKPNQTKHTQCIPLRNTMCDSVQTTELGKFADLKIRRNNSNSSTGTSNSGGKMKSKKSYLAFFNDCKCRVDHAVDQRVGRRLVSNYESIGKGKQSMSRNRTFEWLKQLGDDDVNGGTDSDELSLIENNSTRNQD